MSQLGQSRRFDDVRVTSAYPRIAAVSQTWGHFAFVLKAEAMPTREHSRRRKTTIVRSMLDGSVEPYSVLRKQYQPWRDLGRLTDDKPCWITFLWV